MYPISLIKTISNERFLVDGKHWIPVKLNISLDKSREFHKKLYPDFYVKKEFVAFVSKRYSVVSKSSGKTYTIEIDLYGRKSCNCPGFTFRRKCKHVA